MAKQFIISANSLAEGRIVFLDGDGGWTRNTAEAIIVVEGAGYDAVLKRARRSEAENLVLSVEPIEVDSQDGQIAAKRLRDSIRIAGPTIFIASKAISKGRTNIAAVEAPGVIDPAI